MKISRVICPNCNQGEFREDDRKCVVCGTSLTDEIIQSTLNSAWEDHQKEQQKTTEILAWGNPTKDFERLNISPKCTWTGKSNSGIEMRVYELNGKDFNILCEDAKHDMDGSWIDCAWRSAEGSNMGSVGPRYNINNHYIKAWDGAGREDIIEDNKKEKSEDRYWPERKYKNLLEYFCEEIGVGQPRNVCALAVDLASQNNISMAELFRKYQKE